MIITVDELLDNKSFESEDYDMLQRKLNAIEDMIRSYTHNNFQNRAARFIGRSRGNQIFGSTPYLKPGDTIQISDSSVNAGLYVVQQTTPEYIEVEKELFDYPQNMVTKVQYPAAIKAGVINLMEWEVKNRKKVGIKSETLSRHSTTYYDQDANNQIMGYPVSIMGFLKPYMKARF